jgi:hypothetical protein
VSYCVLRDTVMHHLVCVRTVCVSTV